MLTSASSRPQVSTARSDQAAGGVLLGAVTGVEHRLAAGRRDLVDDRLADVGVELVDDDPRAFAGELDRLTAADAAPRAGDDRDPAVQESHAGDPTHAAPLRCPA